MFEGSPCCVAGTANLGHRLHAQSLLPRACSCVVCFRQGRCVWSRHQVVQRAAINPDGRTAPVKGSTARDLLLSFARGCRMYLCLPVHHIDRDLVVAVVAAAAAASAAAAGNDAADDVHHLCRSQEKRVGDMAAERTALQRDLNNVCSDDILRWACATREVLFRVAEGLDLEKTLLDPQVP